MDEEKIKNIYNVLSTINVTSENEEIVDDIKSDLLNENYMEAMKKLEKLNPIILDFLPLTLEEIFIYEMEALGYEFNEIIQ